MRHVVGEHEDAANPQWPLVEGSTVTESKALDVIEGEFKDIAPVATSAEAKRAMDLYQELASSVTNEEDYQTFSASDGKVHKFRKRSGWKKLERFYGVSVEVKEERIFHDHNPARCLRVKLPDHFKDVVDCGCPVKGVRYVVRAVDVRSGRYSENVGICVAGEKRVSSGASLHDLATRAFNRGANRATADLIGVSDPSAEEAHASGEVTGLSREDKAAIKDAWSKAGEVAKQSATTWMHEAGFIGDSTAALFGDFNQRADDDQVAELLGRLIGAPLGFDPDAVPFGEEKEEATADATHA